MKKFMTSLLCAAALLGGGSIANAEVSPEQLGMGGVTCGMTIAEVEGVHGKPQKSEMEQKPYGEKVEYEYSDSLEITFINGEAVKIEISDRSDLPTADGVRIGMDASVLEAVYGAPDYRYEDKYVYYLKGRRDTGLVFEVKLGKVHEMECGKLD